MTLRGLCRLVVRRDAEGHRIDGHRANHDCRTRLRLGYECLDHEGATWRQPLGNRGEAGLLASLGEQSEERVVGHEDHGERTRWLVVDHVAEMPHH